MFVSVLVRRLRPGKTYDDFVRAWYPDKGFGFVGHGPLLAVNIEDEREILALGFIDLPSREEVEAAPYPLAREPPSQTPSTSGSLANSPTKSRNFSP